MRRFLKIVLFVALLLAVGGHVAYWYLPRERTAAPEPGGLPARLLASGEYDACLWVPYPHQNLGMLAGAVADGPAYLAAAARVADLPPPVMPSFGPFTVPPSREVVACSDLDGERFLLMARVYPALAAVARLAGRLADNPWLAGGEVRQTQGKGDEVVERRQTVAWRDGLWTVSAGQVAGLEETGATEAPRTPSLGVLHLEREVSDFPAGDYFLHRREGDLELALTGGGSELERPALGGKNRPVLLAVAGPSWPAAESRPLPPAAFALFDTDDGVQAGPFGELPGVAVFHPPGRERWSLPAQGIAGLLADRLPKGNAAGWRIVALDAASLRRAKRLAPGIASLAPPEGDAAGARLVLGLWAQPGPTRGLVGRTRGILEKIPLVDPRQVQLWRDWERLLEPVADCEQISLAATQAPPSFGLRFHGCN